MLPGRFTIKALFEYMREITEVNKVVEDFCDNSKAEKFTIERYDH